MGVKAVGVELVTFEQGVPDEGFGWREHPKYGPLLVRRPESRGLKKAEVLPPTAFREFAELGADRDKAAAFASRYGDLTRGTEGPMVPAPDDPKALVPAELLSDWAAESALMAAAVRLWESVRKDDRRALAARYEFTPARTGFIAALVRDPVDPIRRFMSAHNGLDFVRDPRPDAVHPLRVTPTSRPWQLSTDSGDTCLGFCIPEPRNRIDRGLVAGRREVVLVIDQALERKAGVSLDDRSWPPRLAVRPDDLRAMLWCQLLRAVASGVEHRQCRGCPKMFEISNAKGAGTDRKEFCSDACRAKEYRRRVNQAKELAAEGKGVRAIAAEVGSTEEVVRGWVGPPGRRGGRADSRGRKGRSAR